MAEQSFREVRETFMKTVLESVSHMGREQAEQRLSYIVTGLWNEFEQTMKKMSAKARGEQKV